MDLVLIVITLGALVLAVGLSIVGWKLLQQDRTELDRRVEALRALAAAPDVEPAPATDAFDEPMEMPSILAVPATMPVMAASMPMRAMSLAMPAVAEEPALDWDARLGETLHEAGRADEDAAIALDAAFLDGTPAMSPGHRRGLVVAAVAAVMVVTAGTAYAVYRPLTAPARTFVPVNSVPLELLSLSEATDADGTFTVTGLVGNPGNARPAEHVVAVVYLFDRDGHYFATGRAPIDLASLAPGNQSPFVVKVPHGVGAARYRVGFREPDGSVVAHADKRGQSIEGTTEGTATSKGSGQ